MSKPLLRAMLVACSALSGISCLATSPASAASPADATLLDNAVPPVPSLSQVDTAAHTLGSSLNNPVTGSSIVPVMIGGQHPPSLETL